MDLPVFIELVIVCVVVTVITIYWSSDQEEEGDKNQ